MLINIHHAVFDGWSTEILYKELDSYYKYYTQGIAPNLSDLQINIKTLRYGKEAILQEKYYRHSLITGETSYQDLNHYR